MLRLTRAHSANVIPSQVLRQLHEDTGRLRELTLCVAGAEGVVFGNDGSDHHRREVVRSDSEAGVAELNSFEASTIELAGSKTVVSILDRCADTFRHSGSVAALAYHIRAQVRVPEQNGGHELRAEVREMYLEELKATDDG